MTKLFVGGLQYAKTSQDLQTMFEAFGVVNSAQVIIDRDTNQSKGFGFVEMADDAAAQAAIKALDGSEVDGRRLGVSVAKPREERRPSSGGGGGYGGGFNSSRGGFSRDNNRGGGGGNRNRY
jgi:RNA recognition motif-containing protein